MNLAAGGEGSDRLATRGGDEEAKTLRRIIGSCPGTVMTYPDPLRLSLAGGSRSAKNLHAAKRDGVSKMKDKILEIAEIAKACPENLQAICFELLLKDYLGSRAPEHEGKSDSAEPMKKAPEPTTAEGQEPGATEGPGKGQDDLSEVDLHVKARHFLNGGRTKDVSR